MYRNELHNHKFVTGKAGTKLMCYGAYIRAKYGFGAEEFEKEWFEFKMTWKRVAEDMW